ncbi:MAG: oxalurate catabolism protein HpxZ [Roseobacter sp.]
MNEINNPAVLRDVTQVFEQYEAALTGNDIATLDALFWASDHVVRLGATENLYGHDQILAFRKARPSKGLDRSLRNTVITTFGTEFATACTEFTRPGTDRIGRQTHSWVRLADGWKIVAAHVSWMDAS